jgi:Phage Mu protein F like protein
MPVRVDRTDDIQRALANVYLALYKEIKKNENYPSSTILLRQQYNRKVYDSTRKAITQVFAEGHHYVSTRLRVETYQSDTDTTLIKQETDKAVASFWIRLDADATREMDITAARNRLIVTEEPNEFDTKFYLTNASMIATTGALALSTLSKTKQVASDPELDVKKPKIRWVAMQDEKTCTRLPNGGQGCAYLDGQEWDHDDPTIPVPGRLGPNGTHPNCRCYLDLQL